MEGAIFWRRSKIYTQAEIDDAVYEDGYESWSIILRWCPGEDLNLHGYN